MTAKVDRVPLRWALLSHGSLDCVLPATGAPLHVSREAGLSLIVPGTLITRIGNALVRGSLGLVLARDDHPEHTCYVLWTMPSG